MTPPPLDLFPLAPEYLLGTLGAADRRRMERAMSESAVLRREVDATAEAFAAAVAALPAVAGPRPEVRSRLLSSLGSPERFRPFFAELCHLLALPLEAVRALLARIDAPEGWVSLKPGIAMLPFAPGPARSDTGTQAALLRLGPGVSFPRHRHVGPELALVLEGGGHDDGHAYRPGALVEHGPGTSHGFVASPERGLVLVVLHHGIECHQAKGDNVG